MRSLLTLISLFLCLATVAQVSSIKHYDNRFNGAHYGVFDSDRNLYTCAIQDPTTNPNKGIILSKYDNTGQLRWTKVYHNEAQFPDVRIYYLNDQLMLTGPRYENGWSLYLICLDTSGTILKSTLLSFDTKNSFFIGSLTTDSIGNIYFTSLGQGDDLANYCYLNSVDANLKPRFSKKMTEQYSDYPNACVVKDRIHVSYESGIYVFDLAGKFRSGITFGKIDATIDWVGPEFVRGEGVIQVARITGGGPWMFNQFMFCRFDKEGRLTLQTPTISSEASIMATDPDDYIHVMSRPAFIGSKQHTDYHIFDTNLNHIAENRIKHDSLYSPKRLYLFCKDYMKLFSQNNFVGSGTTEFNLYFPNLGPKISYYTSTPDAFQQPPPFMATASTLWDSACSAISRDFTGIFYGDSSLQHSLLYRWPACQNEDFLPDNRMICEADNFDLSARDNFAQTAVCDRNYLYFSWNTGENTKNITATKSGLYKVAVDHYECHYEDSIDLRLDPYICPDFIYLPSAFTPDGDGINDFYKPEGAALTTWKLKVFDRFGREVYQGDETSGGWDGLSINKREVNGLFVIKLDYFDEIEGQEKTVFGKLLIQR